MANEANLVALAVAMLFIGAMGANYVINDDFICVPTKEIMHCEGGISGGMHTRCYLEVKGQSPWKTCSDGWQDLNQFMIENKEISGEYEKIISVYANGRDWTCKSDGSFVRATICTSGSQETHLGALL